MSTIAAWVLLYAYMTPGDLVTGPSMFMAQGGRYADPELCDQTGRDLEAMHTGDRFMWRCWGEGEPGADR